MVVVMVCPCMSSITSTRRLLFLLLLNVPPAHNFIVRGCVWLCVALQVSPTKQAAQEQAKENNNSLSTNNNKNPKMRSMLLGITFLFLLITHAPFVHSLMYAAGGASKLYVAAGGTTMAICNNCCTPFTMPFAINFGTRGLIQTINVCSNGQINLLSSDTANTGCCTGIGISPGSYSMPRIAVFQTDLNPIVRIYLL